MRLRFNANLTMLFHEVPFLDRFAAAAAAGFDAVEFLFPYEYGIEEVRSRAEQHALRIVLFDVPPGDREAGQFGILSYPSRIDAFRRGFETALSAAGRLSCSLLNVLVGKRDPSFSREQQIDTAVENLLWAAPQARDAGVTLLVEALSAGTMPDYLVQRTDEAMALAQAVSHPAVKLQYDFYHAQVNEGNLLATVERWFAHIAHMQIADVPGRHEPGTGEINYPRVFERLEQLGYAGHIGAEYVPSGDTMASFDWLPQRAGS